MDTQWQEFLQAQGARFEAGELCDFGNAAAELDAAANGTVIAPLSQFTLIQATGEEAALFLHRLFSNDINGLALERALRCGFSNPKGRLLSDFLIWRHGGDYLLQLAADLAPALLKKLSLYVLRAKVKLADAGEAFSLIGVSGADAVAALDAAGLEAPEAPLDVLQGSHGVVIRLDAQRFQLALRPEAAKNLWPGLREKARPVGMPAWRWLEIAAGIPHITAATQEEFVAQMVNLELLGGVSFTKGCYPGQEVVARTRYLGRVKRRTYRARVDSGCPQAGTELFSPDLAEQACGKIIAVAPSPTGGCEMLASMLISSAEAGDVRIGSQDGQRLSFLALPYSLDAIDAKETPPEPRSDG